MLLEFIQIAGAVLVETVTSQPRAECQMRRDFATFHFRALGSFDLKGRRRLARAFQPRHDLGADHVQRLAIQRLGLAQPHQQDAGDRKTGRRGDFQKLPRFPRKARRL